MFGLYDPPTIGLLHYRGDAILLSQLKPPADVGVYTIAYRFLEQSFLFPAFLMGTTLAAAATVLALQHESP